LKVSFRVEYIWSLLIISLYNNLFCLALFHLLMVGLIIIEHSILRVTSDQAIRIVISIIPQRGLSLLIFIPSIMYIFNLRIQTTRDYRHWRQKFFILLTEHWGLKLSWISSHFINFYNFALVLRLHNWIANRYLVSLCR